jgi:caffeoyl-CoA O-methyltransferase
MNITTPEVDAYLLRITPSRHEVLREMETLARMNNFPIVGPLVGRVLFLYGRLLQARRVLELGSGYGYSAFWWALATPPDAEIFCTEGSMENIRAAEQFLSRANLWHKVVYYHGDALANMDQIQGEFDIIFMDIDKHQYPQAFLKAFPRLRKGGLYITDNVLWSGRVVEEDPDVSTHAIQQYNELIYNTPGAFSAILPIRDGVSVTLKE